MDKAESIATVDDAVKKLMLLESKGKIWTQEMLLQVSDKAIKLLDCDTMVSRLRFCCCMMIMLLYMCMCKVGIQLQYTEAQIFNNK